MEPLRALLVLVFASALASATFLHEDEGFASCPGGTRRFVASISTCDSTDRRAGGRPPGPAQRKQAPNQPKPQAQEHRAELDHPAAQPPLPRARWALPAEAGVPGAMHGAQRSQAPRPSPHTPAA